MDQAKKERLEAKGWKIGTVSEFLKLTSEESILIVTISAVTDTDQVEQRQTKFQQSSK